MAAKTILIVDDDELSIELLEELLSDAGYKTISARNGAQALRLLETAHTDLIITDLLMPVLDGFGLCRAVLNNPATHTIPLVLTSATYDLRFSVDFPYAGYLPKPFQIVRMLNMLARLIGSATA